MIDYLRDNKSDLKTTMSSRNWERAFEITCGKRIQLHTRSDFTMKSHVQIKIEREHEKKKNS